MILEWIEVSGVRNLSSARLDLAAGSNLLVGPNGSGKTSLLESVYILSTARSYRHGQLGPVITRGTDSAVVRGGVGQHVIGVQRERDGSRRIRVDGEDIKRSSDLAVLLPILLLEPGTIA